MRLDGWTQDLDIQKTETAGQRGELVVPAHPGDEVVSRRDNLY